jgi:hypothetical protein
MLAAIHIRTAGRIGGNAPEPLENLDRPPDSPVLRLPDDLRPRLDLETVYVERSKSSSSTQTFTVRLAPLVRPAWTPSDPVQAWAICADWQQQCREIPTEGAIGIVTDPWDQNTVEGAVASALADHGLKGGPNPVLVSLHPSVNAALEESHSAVYGGPRIFWLAWLVTRGGWELYERLWGARSGRRKESAVKVRKP